MNRACPFPNIWKLTEINGFIQDTPNHHIKEKKGMSEVWLHYYPFVIWDCIRFKYLTSTGWYVAVFYISPYAFRMNMCFSLTFLYYVNRFFEDTYKLGNWDKGQHRSVMWCTLLYDKSRWVFLCDNICWSVFLVFSDVALSYHNDQ